MMNGFCSNNALCSASLSFTIFLFLLTPFDIWDCYYFKSNPSQLMYIKVLLTSKEAWILFYSLLNMKKQLSLMGLFLCLSRISFGDIIKKMSKVGVREKKIKRGGWTYRVEVVFRMGGSNRLRTMLILICWLLFLNIFQDFACKILTYRGLWWMFSTPNFEGIG